MLFHSHYLKNSQQVPQQTKELKNLPAIAQQKLVFGWAGMLSNQRTNKLKMKIHFLLLLFTSTTLSSFGQWTFGYNLEEPGIRHQLPNILNEISGLTDIDSTHVACVQDEIGTVFIYNFKTGDIVSQHRFDSIGDFEGLTYTSKALYILRSDGRLTEWNNFPVQNASIKQYKLSLATSNNEGLCFDSKNSRLLIAAKSKPINHDEKSERFIYAFNLKTKKLDEKPVYSLNVDSLSIRALQFGIEQLVTTAKGERKPFNFRPASLAVHPITDDIYVISAADRILLVMNRKGEVIFMKQLDAELYAKAEGITFLKDGTMIITNEAAGKTPNLYVFGMSL